MTDDLALTIIPLESFCELHEIVDSMDRESSQQLQMWFVTPIGYATLEQIWREKISEKPHSIRLLR